MSAAAPSPVSERSQSTGGNKPSQESYLALAPVVSSEVSVVSPPESSRNVSDGVDSAKETYINGVLGEPVIDYSDDLLDDETLLAELRKLDEDFKKNVMRAKKVFDSRMDNLQRTQYQREALHKKTLEKTLERHEKERVEFEKRLQQEEIEQKRRIENLQREWDRRREAVRQKQLAEAAAEAKSLGAAPSEHANLASIKDPSEVDRGIPN